MTSVGQGLFDPDQLLQIAGEKAFKRGQAYADHGQITLLSASDDGVFAAAFGTDDYTVWLRRPGPEISGHCTCPAYDDAGFCKHLVATALVANDSVQQGDNLPDKIGEIAARIAGLNKRQLENLLLEMATADWRTLRSLCLSLDLGWDDDLD